jgi:hypothetical protein
MQYLEGIFFSVADHGGLAVKGMNCFAYSNFEVMDSNRTRDMNICVCLFCVCAVLCVGSDLYTG